MKANVALVLATSIFAMAVAVQVQDNHDVANGDRTITQVVKLLQGMLDKSKTEGETECELYAKFKCYCDKNDEEKTTSVKEATREIGLLENQIQALQGSSGQLSSDAAQLKAEIAANEEARNTATALRTSENADYIAEKVDLEASISQLGQAIQVLGDIGADQNLQTAADHTKFLGGYEAGGSLLKVRTSVKQALVVAKTFLSPAQRAKVSIFLQQGAPFTGTYTAQSGEIMGILTQMKSTFESNLQAANSAEQAAAEAHGKFMQTKQEEHRVLSASYDAKQALLSGNDGDLGTKKQQLSEAKVSKVADEAFLATLATSCAEKAADHEKRTLLRTNEEAAIAKAIAILNSEQAFQTFGNVAATRTGPTSFVQLKAAKSAASPRDLAQRVLRRASAHSARLRRVAALLQAGNPFDKVLGEIAKLQAHIDEEAAVDKKQFDWCADERTTNNAEVSAKEAFIMGFEGDITVLENTIDDPSAGLKAQISALDEDLEANGKSQSDETGMRRDENKAYKVVVDDTVEAQALLTRALSVLKKYYEALDEEENGFLQKSKGYKDSPTPPSTWSGDYSGQSTTGQNVIQMLEFILSETAKEEQAAHEAEALSQKSYEDSMEGLKSAESGMQTELANLKKNPQRERT